jgi:hypothetical protein
MLGINCSEKILFTMFYGCDSAISDKIYVKGQTDRHETAEGKKQSN